MTANTIDESFPPTVADTSDFPHRVRTKGLALVYPVVMCTIGIGMDGVLAASLVRSVDDAQKPFVLIAALGCLALAATCFYGLYRTLVPYLILFPDRLEQRGLVGRWRALMRSDIKGVRSAGSGRADAFFEIVPTDGKGAAVLLRKTLRKDPVVARWLQGALNLGAADAAADYRAAVLADPRFGATPAERETRLERAKGAALLFNLACIPAGILSLFLFDDLQVRLAVAAGSLVIGALLVQWSAGLIVWVPAKGQPGLIGPVVLAFLIAYQNLDLHLIGGATLVWIAAATALAFAAFLALRNPTLWIAALPILFYGGLLLYGLAAATNVAFAPRGTRMFPLLVNGMYESGSKNRSYNLKVAAWDDQPAGAISVPVNYYDKVQVGSLVCVFRHKGALGIDWYDVHDCPAGSKASPVALAEFAAQPHNAPPPARAPSSRPQTPVYYPDRAMRAGKEGRAVVHCEVVNGGLVDCRVQSEDPLGYGFGRAAVGRIMGTDGSGGVDIKPEQLKGRTEVDIPVNFKLTN